MGGSQEWPHVDGIEEQQTWHPEQLWPVASNKQTKKEGSLVWMDKIMKAAKVN